MPIVRTFTIILAPKMEIRLRKPKMRDISSQAGVSIATVSLALSGKGRISPEVRQKVIQVAGDLGYFESQQMSDRNQLSNKNIGMLYSFDTNWSHVHQFFAPLVTTVEEIFRKNGHYLSLITFTQTTTTDDLFDRILHDNIRALISVNYANKELFTRLEEIGIPVVLANNLEYQDLFYSAGVDDFQGTYEATKYLLNLGHKQIAYFDYPDGTFHPMANRRFYAFRAALEESGIEKRESDRVIIDVNNQDALIEDIRSLLDSDPPPTAFVSDDDNLMMNVLHAAGKLGLRIPEDISAIAHGDIQDYERAHTPRLTTMRINTAQLGKLAAEMLIDRLNHRLDEIQVVKLKEQLVDRGSCLCIDGGAASPSETLTT